MTVHISYKSQTETFVTASASVGAPQDAASLAMAHLLLGKKRDFEKELRAVLDAPAKTEPLQRATGDLLNRAVAAALLDEAPQAHLEDLVKMLPAIQKEGHETVRQRALIDAVCACAWLDHAKLEATLNAWHALSPSHAVIDAAITRFANDVLLDRAAPPEAKGPEAMLAIASFGATQNDRHRLLATLLAHGRAATATALTKGRRLVDEDLFEEDPNTPRATYAKPTWRYAKGKLRLRVTIKGSGGELRAVGPFLEPAYACVKDLDRFASGKQDHGAVDGVDSKKKLAAILADPEQEIAIAYQQGKEAFLEEKAVAAHQPVLDGITRWMSTRYGDAFGARLVLEVDGV